MKINFKVSSFPSNEQLQDLGFEAYVLYLEGKLQIDIENKCFFDEPEFTLVELAIAMNKWLEDSENNKDFVYETMDYDEGPIIVFKYIKDGKYQVESIWQQTTIEDLISKEKIIKAFKDYLSNLDNTLQKNLI